VETLGFHNLEAADEIYFTSPFALIALLSVTPLYYLNSNTLAVAAADDALRFADFGSRL
jgi:hypothetical protein